MIITAASPTSNGALFRRYHWAFFTWIAFSSAAMQRAENHSAALTRQWKPPSHCYLSKQYSHGLWSSERTKNHFIVFNCSNVYTCTRALRSSHQNQEPMIVPISTVAKTLKDLLMSVLRPHEALVYLYVAQIT